MDKNKVTKGTATYVTEGKGFVGPAPVYKLDPALHGVDHVALSTITAETQQNSLGALLGFTTDAAETKLIPADGEGQADFDTLLAIATGPQESLTFWAGDTEFEGEVSPEDAFARYGYEVVS